MILQEINKGQNHQKQMSKHRMRYNKIKQLVNARKFDEINISEIYDEK